MLWLVTDVDTEFDGVRFSGKPKYSADPGLTEGIPHFLEFFAEYNIRATFHIQEQSAPEQSILLHQFIDLRVAQQDALLWSTLLLSRMLCSGAKCSRAEHPAALPEGL